MISLAINGYGRIGRCVLRAFYEAKRDLPVKIAAINGLGAPNVHAHLTQYDTTHGRFAQPVRLEGSTLWIGADRIPIFNDRNPQALPWKELGIDVVLECTGRFTSKMKANEHLLSGARKVLISAPAPDADATIVYGVNHHSLRPEHRVVSNASCTTNCLAPLVWPLQKHLGIVSGLMTTVHAYTNDQVLADVYHEDLRRARAAAHNVIPTQTGAASSLGLVIPELAGRLDGFALRVPTLNVSMVDLNFIAKRSTSVQEVHQILRQASENELKGILAYNDQPLVSSDFNHHPASSIYDASLTKVGSEGLVKVCAWYDNEWAFSQRMVDVAIAMAQF